MDHEDHENEANFDERYWDAMDDKALEEEKLSYARSTIEALAPFSQSGVTCQWGVFELRVKLRRIEGIQAHHLREIRVSVLPS